MNSGCAKKIVLLRDSKIKSLRLWLIITVPAGTWLMIFLRCFVLSCRSFRVDNLFRISVRMEVWRKKFFLRARLGLWEFRERQACTKKKWIVFTFQVFHAHLWEKLKLRQICWRWCGDNFSHVLHTQYNWFKLITSNYIRAYDWWSFELDPYYIAIPSRIGKTAKLFWQRSRMWRTEIFWPTKRALFRLNRSGKKRWWWRSFFSVQLQ